MNSPNNHKQIFLVDGLNAEDNAMLQALYSRSARSVQEHLEQVNRETSGAFMKKYYIGYGHASIADCGTATLFIENVSILADKVLQDYPLYAGQETSTRYLDMSQRPIIDPLDSEDSRRILKRWMSFYQGNLLAIQEHLVRCHPQPENISDKQYLATIKARAFDVMRGFLPAGITTQLSWHSNLRQLYERLTFLKHHPLMEVRDIADSLWQLLAERYSSSFIANESTDLLNYLEKSTARFSYFQPKKEDLVDFRLKHTLNTYSFVMETDLFKQRPRNWPLPNWINEAGDVTFDFLLDYGSFRDIHRHRNGSCRLPLLNVSQGFHPWYLEQLPGEILQSAKELIQLQSKDIKKLPANEYDKQYYVALGFQVPCRVTYNLLAAIYVIELRTQLTVHPTLRQIARKMYESLKPLLAGLTIHADNSPDRLVWQRGQQDITLK